MLFAACAVSHFAAVHILSRRVLLPESTAETCCLECLKALLVWAGCAFSKVRSLTFELVIAVSEQVEAGRESTVHHTLSSFLFCHVALLVVDEYFKEVLRALFAATVDRNLRVQVREAAILMNLVVGPLVLLKPRRPPCELLTPSSFMFCICC